MGTTCDALVRLMLSFVTRLQDDHKNMACAVSNHNFRLMLSFVARLQDDYKNMACAVSNHNFRLMLSFVTRLQDDYKKRSDALTDCPVFVTSLRDDYKNIRKSFWSVVLSSFLRVGWHKLLSHCPISNACIIRGSTVESNTWN
jgi:hypothetical protein